MKRIMMVSSLLCLGICFTTVCAVHAGFTINSYTEANGNQHPGSGAIRGPVSITCTVANGNPGYPASCNVTAPGYAGTVDLHKTVGASGAGTVTLTCNGQAPLRCAVAITP